MFFRRKRLLGALTLVSYALCALVGMGWHELAGCHHDCHVTTVAGCDHAEAGHSHADHDQDHSVEGEGIASSASWHAPGDCPICRYQAQAQAQAVQLHFSVAELAAAASHSPNVLRLPSGAAEAYLARGPPQLAS
ncbi:MAG: hypothetical protein JSS27_13005 [Planctomycetes bacterium]|nr:hypothetical protein [Planctomycetota bacterium]